MQPQVRLLAVLQGDEVMVVSGKDKGKKGKIEVIPNGIDLSEYADLPPKGSFKKKFGIDEDKKMIYILDIADRKDIYRKT